MSGESILIVEDEGLIALHLSEILEAGGYRIAGMEFSGETVLRTIGKDGLPDLILMDIALAGKMNGIEAARCIRERYDIPVIFLSAYSGQNRIEEAHAVSPYGYLRKPVVKDDLLNAVRGVLDQRKQ